MGQAAPVVVGYVYPGEVVLNASSVHAESLTRINYAFAALKNGRMTPAAATEATNLAVLTGLKKTHPELAVLVSVGGWGRSGQFSGLASTAASRKAFVQSVLEFLTANHLDGLDVDWEYPCQSEAGPHSPRDRENFTLLLRDLREAFDRQTAATHHRLLLSIAAGVNDEYLQHTEMEKVSRLVDSVNLMTYDMVAPETNDPAGHHAPLFTNPASPSKDSVDSVVHAFLKAGVQPQKLVVGIPFYAHVWARVNGENHGLFQAGKSSPLNFATYEVITQKLSAEGFVRYWDEAASAPWLYNAATKTFVSYDDAASVAAKCDYVLAQKLGGVMFWQYSGDPSGELVRTMHQHLDPAEKR